jgi:hypothetical protein
MFSFVVLPFYIIGFEIEYIRWGTFLPKFHKTDITKVNLDIAIFVYEGMYSVYGWDHAVM